MIILWTSPNDTSFTTYKLPSVANRYSVSTSKLKSVGSTKPVFDFDSTDSTVGSLKNSRNDWACTRNSVLNNLAGAGSRLFFVFYFIAFNVITVPILNVLFRYCDRNSF
jgi:hypothetical protein